jgi:hypothetical protein
MRWADVSKITVGYLSSLALLSVWGGMNAFAQTDPGGIPATNITVPTGVGALSLDLGNLTVPGAVVVSVWLFTQSGPFKAFGDLIAGLAEALKKGTVPLSFRVDVRHRSDGDEDSGIFRVVRADRDPP